MKCKGRLACKETDRVVFQYNMGEKIMYDIYFIGLGYFQSHMSLVSEPLKKGQTANLESGFEALLSGRMSCTLGPALHGRLKFS